MTLEERAIEFCKRVDEFFVRLTEGEWFDRIAGDIHPDEINNLCDTVAALVGEINQRPAPNATVYRVFVKQTEEDPEISRFMSDGIDALRDNYDYDCYYDVVPGYGDFETEDSDAEDEDCSAG